MGAVRNQVSFLLNGERHDVPREVAPTRTLLDYLREDCGLKGTKEGCNEGDCGACTVVVGEISKQSSVDYRAVNACITFVPMVDGKSVITVEGLRGPNGELHPVQQAMVECHGSQCGFCTPGFVMSLYPEYLILTNHRWLQHSPNPNQKGRPKRDYEHRIAMDELFAGNLCRCTGYGPIVKAGQRLLGIPCSDWDMNRVEHELALLKALPNGGLALDHPSGQFFAPEALDEFAELYEVYPSATVLAGGTDIGLWVTKQQRELSTLISVGRVSALNNLETHENKLVIYSGVPYSDALEFLPWYWPDLGELVRRIGSVQVRNSGTVGGNIANGSPIGDMAPALIVLGATVDLRKGKATRSLPLEDYFVAYGKQDRQPGEFIESISIPGTMLSGQVETKQTRLRCYKISKRFDQDISAVLGCFNLHIEAGMVASARIAFGGMAGIPTRAKAVEAALLGKPWTLHTAEAALPAFEADFQPISDARASAAYRLQVAKNLLIRYLHETTSDVPTRLVGRGHDVHLRPDDLTTNA